MPASSPHEHVSCVVIGAGAVGLAVAAQLSKRFPNLIVLEQESVVGSGVSSRSSEVIHAGLYYPSNSLKASLCVLGRRLLNTFLPQRRIPHRICGKIIVAPSTNDEQTISNIHKQALLNGVDDVRLLSARETRKLEPHVRAVSSLLSPSTGIFDTHAFMLSLQAELETNGGVVAFNAPLVGGETLPQGGGVLHVGGNHPMTLQTNVIINAAGLHATHVASSINGYDAHQYAPTPLYAKGSYFSFSKPSPFSRLVYPAPVPGGLGVHATLDLAGRVRFGPDVEWVDQPDFTVNPNRAASFLKAVRSYWPDAPDNSLQPDYAGVRPKIRSSNNTPQDFIVQSSQVHRCDGIVHLFGVESPGLTAALAIAQTVDNLL